MRRMLPHPSRPEGRFWTLLLLVPLFLAADLPAPTSSEWDESQDHEQRAAAASKAGQRRLHRALSPAGQKFVADRTGRGFGGVGREYLRFGETPDLPERRRLREKGIVLSEYAGNRTYMATVSDSGRQFLRRQTGITELGAIPIADKIGPALLAGDIHSWGKGAPGRALVRVRYFRHTPLADALAVIQANAGTAIEDRGYPHSFLLHASIPESSVFDLAESEIVRSISLKRPRAIPFNASAAAQHKTDVVWEAPYNLTGAGYLVGVWDVGAIHPHPEFGSRLSWANGFDLHTHATHVAGTIGAAGDLGVPDSAPARGMASQVGLRSYDSNFNYNEYIAAVNGGEMVVANNSWGVIVGWEWFPGCDQSDGCLPPIPAQWLLYNNSGDFGRYALDSAQVDDAADYAEISGQTFLIVAPAGNHRDDPGPGLPHDGTYFPNADENLYYSYYDSIGPLGTAKNSLTVGSVGPQRKMTLYSGWGPTDDGRIKPDLVAEGAGLHSPSGSFEYSVMDGTSQAAAVVSGSSVLVIEQYETTNGVPPTTSELKALLLNSTTDLGNPGPDYVYGYGLLNTLLAVDTVLAEGDTATIESGELDHTDTDTYQVEVIPGTPSLRCTLAWMDPFGNYTAPVPSLINDLDLRLISPSDQVHYPYSLSLANPLGDATATGPNTVDTVEQVLVENPEVGAWTVEVKGSFVPLGPQKYGLASKNGLSAPKVVDFLPPDRVTNFPYPYRRPILSASYFDPAGGDIDLDSVVVKLESFDVTSLSVIDENGAYFAPTFDLWLDHFLFKVTVANTTGAGTSAVLDFSVVDAAEVQDLAVDRGPAGEAELTWGNSAFDPNFLWLEEYRVYRSVDLQQEMQWIGTTEGHSFTDASPPPGLVHYEVHALFDVGSGNRVLSTRGTPHRTQQPFLGYPNDNAFEPLPGGTAQVRFLGMSEPGSEVKLYVDGTEVGATTTLVDGSFRIDHDFGGPGSHTAFVQAKAANESISVPSVEIDLVVPVP